MVITPQMVVTDTQGTHTKAEVAVVLEVLVRTHHYIQVEMVERVYQ
jgi:hypothetical protein